jgi:galactonate dehydratase
MQIPDAPGLGIDLNEAAIAEHPYQPKDLRHYTGALTDIRPKESSSYYERP